MWASNSRKLVWAVGLILLGVPALMWPQSLDLPPGPAQEKVRTSCTECHDSHIIRQQRLTNKAWTKEVDKMIKWGAVVDPADRNAFIDFLSINFPPGKPAEASVRVGVRQAK
jgi:hypothetical protein